MHIFIETLIPAFPELLIMVSSVLFISFEKLLKKTNLRRIFFVLSNFVIGLSLITLFLYIIGFRSGFSFFDNPNLREITFSGVFIIDGFTGISKIILLFCATVFIYIFQKNDKSEKVFEKTISFLLMIAGYMLIISSNDFILLFIGFELSSIAIAILSFLDGEVTNDYNHNLFFVHCVGSSILLFGCALFYMIYGTTNFSVMVDRIVVYKDNIPLILKHIAAFLIVLGIFAKSLFVPFHGMFVSISSKASWRTFSLLSVFPYFVSTVLVIKFFSIFNLFEYKQILLIFGLIGAILGFINATNQNNLKGVISCNIIGNVGIALTSFAVSGINSVTGIFLFFIVQSIALLIFFGIVLYVSSNEKHISTISDVSFIRSFSPFLAFVFGFGVMSFINIPSLPGFMPLFVLLKNISLEGNYVVLAIIVALKMLSFWTGFNIVKNLFTNNQHEVAVNYNNSKRGLQLSSKILIFFAFILLLSMTIFIDKFYKNMAVGEYSLRYLDILEHSTAKPIM